MNRVVLCWLPQRQRCRSGNERDVYAKAGDGLEMAGAAGESVSGARDDADEWQLLQLLPTRRSTGSRFLRLQASPGVSQRGNIHMHPELPVLQ